MTSITVFNQVIILKITYIIPFIYNLYKLHITIDTLTTVWTVQNSAHIIRNLKYHIKLN